MRPVSYTHLAPPKLSITAIVKYLKGITGRKLFERFPEIRNQLWKGELWNHSYYEMCIRDRDGAVWFGHWGCKHTLGAAQLAKKKFEEAGLPLLILDGDGCDRSHGGEGDVYKRQEPRFVSCKCR